LFFGVDGEWTSFIFLINRLHLHCILRNKTQQMKIKLIGFFLTLISLLTIVVSCNKEGENSTNISSTGGNKSHNQGKNCMTCHTSGGEGEGWFNVAGTVYDSLKTSTYPNGIVQLHTGPGGTGTLKYTIYVDAKGNFYTTEAIDFGSGLYPSIQGGTSTHYMSSTIGMGQCNSCHGVSTDKLWTN